MTLVILPRKDEIDRLRKDQRRALAAQSTSRSTAPHDSKYVSDRSATPRSMKFVSLQQDLKDALEQVLPTVLFVVHWLHVVIDSPSSVSHSVSQSLH